jgi:hypothetical protein
VSFGGIIGLFLGGSLLSAVELVYYLMVAVYSSFRRQRSRRVVDDPETNTTIIRATVLPILDYRPLKPQANRIPIFANCGLAESNVKRY